MPAHRALLALALVATYLPACGRPQPGMTPTPFPPRPTSTAAPTPSPTTVPTATPTPNPECAESRGKLHHAQVEIPGDDRPLAYWVYVPPCFDPDREISYPALYLLHGLAQSESQWIDLGVAASADALISRGAAPAFIIIMPGERTGYDMLEALVDVLVPSLEGALPSGGQPGLRAIGGISRGAGWALRIGLQRPDLFGAIGLHSPAVISPDLYAIPTWGAEVPRDSIPRLWIDIGADDTLLPAARDLREQLDRLRWPYTWSVGYGEHTPAYWASHLEEYLRWYTAAWPTQAGSGDAGRS